MQCNVPPCNVIHLLMQNIAMQCNEPTLCKVPPCNVMHCMQCNAINSCKVTPLMQRNKQFAVYLHCTQWILFTLVTYLHEDLRSIQCNTILITIQNNAQYLTIQCSIPYNTMLNTIHYNAQYSALQCSIQHNTMLNTAQDNAQYNTLQCSIQCSTTTAALSPTSAHLS